MQTSLSRRQRHRRNGAARRGRGSGSARKAALAIPLILFGSFLALGSVGFVAAVSAYAYYSRDLPDPRDALKGLGFDQPSIIYDRSGDVELARFGERKRDVVTFDELPNELLDATTAVEDKDYWTNPGFDLGGFISATIDTIQGNPRGGSTITQQLVRARLLPEKAFEGSTYERKAREIIQSIRLTQAYPGEDGKKEIITAYLNQNFYGNQSYGVAAAAKGYFGKELADLTLAEAALLAAIPQSPTQYDLVRNAVATCTVEVAEGAECPRGKVLLTVPQDSDIIVRRNRVLDLMADPSRSVLSGDDHVAADYQAAKAEEVVLAPQGTAPLKAAHFVWQVREELGAILCGEENATTCEKVDTGGYRVTTTLNWEMQQIAEKWTFAAARTPNFSDPQRSLRAIGIPAEQQGWIVDLVDGGIHNAASAVIDYRTGEVLAHVGSAGYYAAADPQFDPEYDVLAQGYRQPGSAIKPLNYITGIDDGTMTAATMFMDVTTDFGGQQPFTPTQADKKERGPVRLRSALQFSLNIPSIKAGLINGLDHLFQRTKDFGLSYLPNTVPVTSMSIGTLEVRPIEMVAAYGAIADGGMLMPRRQILEVKDATGKVVYPTPEDQPEGKRVASEQASFIVTDILQGNTIKSVNPYWGEFQILQDGERRPAAYKTGTTSDNKDVHAYGYLAPPADPAAPALAVGVWMGNSDSTPNQGSLSLDSSAPLWSAILTEISQGLPIADFVRPERIVEADVDAFSGLMPGPYTVKTVKELFIEGTVPTRTDNLHAELDIDEATGLLWSDGCTGPMVKKGFLDFSDVEPQFSNWQPYTQEWAARAARGVNVVGGPEKTATMWFYQGSFAPFGKTWGGAFAPTQVCAPVEPPICDPDTSFDPAASPAPTPCIPEPTAEPTDEPTPKPSKGGGKPTPTPEVTLPPLPLPTATTRRSKRLRTGLVSA